VLVALALVMGVLGVPTGADPAGAATTGTLSGTVTVNGRSDVPSVVMICPGTVTIADLSACASPAWVPADGAYSTTLAPGTYSVAAINYVATAYLSPTATVTVTAGGTTIRNLAISAPGATGTVSVTGVPAGFTVEERWVQYCPGSVTVTAWCEDGWTFDVAADGTYDAILPASGTGSLAAVYRYADGTFVGPTSKPSLPSGAFTTVNLTVPWTAASVGAASGTLTITGRPAGTSVQPFVLACPGTTVTTDCVSSEGSSLSFGDAGNAGRYATVTDGAAGAFDYSIPALAPGTWTLWPGYRLGGGSGSSFSFGVDAGAGAVVGTPVTFTVSANQAQVRSLSVAWLAGRLGRVTGSIVRTGATDEAITGNVLACPGTGLVRPGCAGGRSVPVGPPFSAVDAYDLTLPAGTWSLRLLTFGNRLRADGQVTVAVTAGATVQRDLGVAVVQPGTVSGSVTAPAGVAIAGLVVACPGSRATATTSCDDGRTAYFSGAAGAPAPYAVEVPPGTWSLAAFDFSTTGGSRPATVVEVGPGQTVTRALSTTPAPSTSPVAVTGRIQLAGATAEQARATPLDVQACPGNGGVTDGCAGGRSAWSYYVDGGPCFSLPGNCEAGYSWFLPLPPGSTWSVRASYRVGGPATTSRAKVSGPTSVITIPAIADPAEPLRQDLTVDWAPTGTLDGTVQVTGRPASQLPLTRVDACPGTLPPTSDCAGGVSQVLVPLLWLRSSNTWSLQLPAGTWSLRMRHTMDGRDWVSGPAATRTLAAGTTVTANLTAPATVVRTFAPTFGDVPAGAFYADAAEWLKLRDITTGFGGDAGRYAPDVTVTRGQMAAFLWRMMGSPTGSPASGFTDVPANAFYAEATRWLKARAITTGYGGSPTRFAPDELVTRSQMATFLWRLAGSPAGATGSAFFVDVPAGSSYDSAVAWLWERGITTGYGRPDVFGPAPVVTRAQMAAFLYRLALDQGLA
jgi:hypothetical protein